MRWARNYSGNIPGAERNEKGTLWTKKVPPLVYQAMAGGQRWRVSVAIERSNGAHKIIFLSDYKYSRPDDAIAAGEKWMDEHPEELKLGD